MTSDRKAALVIGAIGGVWTLAAIMMPSTTPFFVWLAPIGPIAAGVGAALYAARKQQRELEVDDAAFTGLLAGTAGGFIVAVPFPLAMSLFVARGSRPQLGTAASIGIAALLLVAFIAVSVVCAVIAARIAAR